MIIHFTVSFFLTFFSHSPNFDDSSAALGFFFSPSPLSISSVFSFYHHSFLLLFFSAISGSFFFSFYLKKKNSPMCKLTRYRFCVTPAGPNRRPPRDELTRCLEWPRLVSDARTGDAAARNLLKTHMEGKLSFFFLPPGSGKKKKIE